LFRFDVDSHDPVRLPAHFANHGIVRSREGVGDLTENLNYGRAGYCALAWCGVG